MLLPLRCRRFSILRWHIFHAYAELFRHATLMPLFSLIIMFSFDVFRYALRFDTLPCCCRRYAITFTLDYLRHDLIRRFDA